MRRPIQWWMHFVAERMKFMDKTKQILVELAYALPDKQMIIPVKVDEGSTAYDAAELSGIAEHFSQINLNEDKMGIFGKMLKDPKKEQLKAGDRVEIYRPLLIDPKASRAARADKAKQVKNAKAE